MSSYVELLHCSKGLVGLRLLLFVYVMYYVYMVKKIQYWDFIKNGHSKNETFHTSNPENFKRGNFFYGSVNLKLT